MDGTLAPTLVAVAMGIGLSAACGFRVFLPILFLSLATHFGYVHPAPAWLWVGSAPAIITLATATLVEVLAYYIPWLDHALDTIAAPAALVAGTLMTASLVTDVNPFLKWSLALIAGGGVAGIAQTITMAVRVASTATTGGLANPIVSTIESVGAIVLATLAILAPLVAVGVIVLAVLIVARFVSRILRRRRAAAVVAPAQTPAGSSPAT
jgi:hypothetical protein